MPVPQGPNLVTNAGLALIAERIATLTAGIAGAQGEAAEALRRDLRYWQTRHATAMLTAPPADGSAGFATRVAFLLNGKPRTIAIVGDDEADPKHDRIAYSAPLARALSGAEPGETLAFAGRDDAITLLSVTPLEM
nr:MULTISPECIES: GreA/GreB family elongation factor [unclassified Sphingomonas]